MYCSRKIQVLKVAKMMSWYRMAVVSLSPEHPETKHRALRKTSQTLSSCELLVRLVALLLWQTVRSVLTWQLKAFSPLPLILFV